MSGIIQVTRDGAVATITLNRPERMNALDLGAWEDLGKVMDTLSADDDLRCVVMRGAGDKAFSAGADIEEFPERRLNSAQAEAYGKITHRTMRAIAECRHPTIAVIKGACVGGGLELASVCDLRVCTASSKFGVPIKRLGLVLSYGELAGLIALTGTAVAMEMLLEGRVFGAQEALDKRLVNRVIDDAEFDGEVDAILRRISTGAPLVARWHKKFARRLAQNTPLSEEEQREAFACFDTEDFRIGYQAFLNKATPEFTGR
ncbi:MAG: enoyl-CoA hydratase-related protein [Burkholderiaceae bacterium]